MKMHIKKGDMVQILSGDERGKKGKVLDVSPSEGKVIIEARNHVKKHVKPKKAGERGGIVNAESAMYASKVAVICSRCNKPARVGYEIDDEGIKTRICRSCGKTL